VREAFPVGEYEKNEIKKGKEEFYDPHGQNGSTPETEKLLCGGAKKGMAPAGIAKAIPHWFAYSGIYRGYTVPHLPKDTA
jgi:hypothetical protein